MDDCEALTITNDIANMNIYSNYLGSDRIL